MFRRTSLASLALATFALGCSPSESIDAALPHDGGTDAVDAFAIDDDAYAIDDDAFVIDDDAFDATVVERDAHAVADAVSDGGFRTSLSCPDFMGLPAAGVTLPGASPEGVRIGPDCSVYVAMGDTIHRLEQGTGGLSAFATRASSDFQGIEFGADGRMYVTDRVTNSVLRFDATTGAYVDVFASTTLDGPNTPRFGPDGRLYVSCRNTANVVRFEPDGTALGEFATHTLLESPEGISFGPDGHLYVAARIQSVVMRFDGTTGAFLSQVTPTGAPFQAPENIAFTSDGSLWIASRDAREILRFDAYTGIEIERFPTLATEEPIGMDVAADQLVVGMRGTGRVLVFR